MKKKWWLIGIVAVVLLLVIPIPTGVYKDGGTRTYTALTYKIVGWNHMYGNGTYQQTKVYPFPMNFMSLDSLLSEEEPYFTQADDEEKTADEGVQYDTYGKNTQYVRTNGRKEGTRYPKAVLIRSVDELDDYYAANKNFYSLDRGTSDGNVSFLDACRRYDDAYFEKQLLVLVLLEEGSGSIRHQVTNVYKDPDGFLNIRITREIPETGTADMARWHLFVEVGKGIALPDESKIVVIMDDDEAYRQEVYCGNTQTTVYFQDGKKYTFLSGNSVLLTDILRHLSYDPQKICRCLPEYTVDTEFGTGYGISLRDHGYVRCEKGQAELTQEQYDQIQSILLWAEEQVTSEPGETENDTVTDFALRLFKETGKPGENTLISPMSILCALAMTANGAEEETLQQMESVMGMTTDELNRYLSDYMQNLPQGVSYQLKFANSIWLAEDPMLQLDPAFLQTNEAYYNADIYKTVFDEQALQEINAWVSGKTDGMIPQILDKMPEDAVICLINALAFDGQWESVYTENQVRDGQFTKADGTKQTAFFMYCEEGAYLEDGQATGFMKYYKGGKYAFVALLPNEGVTVEEYVASLDGAKLQSLLSKPQNATVYTSIPKFEAQYGVEMSKILKEMGMPNAFDPNTADFDRIGSFGGVGFHISQVLHKSVLRVDEKGTKAGAATAVVMAPNSARPTEPKTVHLNRPFVYMLIDCENHIPFFMGTMMDLEQ